jgi:tetratricopeptide (TPR) repeat protein
MWNQVLGKTVGLAALFAGFALSSFAQTGAIAGKVIGPDGQPLQNAMVHITRTDIRGNYKVKTNKKGEYFHAGLPLGMYNVTLEVQGKQVDSVQGVRTTLGDPTEVNFDLKALAQRQAAMQRAAETGQLTEEQKREMTPEQRAAMEKAMRERAEALKKNKALNDAFNAGMTAMEARQWEQAVEAFTRAGELDPNQHVVWANLAESYVNLASTKPANEQAAILEKGLEAWQKAIDLKMDDAGYHNNYALALARAKKFDEAEAELSKAAALDPARAGTYFFNLGAVLVNTGQLEPAGAAFKKAIEADPKHANAQYQYGVYLMSKATVTPEGRVMPPEGTKEAFQAYLQLEPNGPYADSAKGMLQSIEASVQTEYVNPEAQKGRGRKK